MRVSRTLSDAPAEPAAQAVEPVIPAAELPRQPDSVVSFQVEVLEGGVEPERRPQAAPIAVAVEEVHA